MDEEMQDFFRRFFGQPMPGVPRQGPPPNRPQAPQEEERPRGVGSGFILSSDGFVMTNAHVVDGASEVLVTLPDKREFKARIVGADKRTDVAVVKIDATGLPAVKVGDISKLRVGEWVMAIGSPFGLENTVTAGIVSAKQRDTGDYLPFIQTDVAINPGNSGGPLINMRGEVVGINSQIYSRSGGFMGISFSIPIDEAIRVSDQLRAFGRVSRGRIGVQIDQVTKDVAESIGLGKAQGALVRGVEAGSPGEKAGIEPGDIITKFDGKSIEKPSDLPRLVGNTKPGTKSSVTVFRRGNLRDLNVTIAEIEPDKPCQASVGSGRLHGKGAGFRCCKVNGAGVERSHRGAEEGVEAQGWREGRCGHRRRGPCRTARRRCCARDQQCGSGRRQGLRSRLGKGDKSKPVSLLFRRGDWAQYALLRPSR